MKRTIIILSIFLSMNFFAACAPKFLNKPGFCPIKFTKPKKGQNFIMSPNTLSVAHNVKCNPTEEPFEASIDVENERMRDIAGLFNYIRPYWRTESIELPLGNHSLIAAAVMSSPFKTSKVNTELVDLNILPAPDSNIKIMPLGDSITQGFPHTDGGYRRRLCDDLISENYNIIFVGSKGGDSNSNIDNECKYHEGHIGFTTKMILDGISEESTRPPEGKLSEWLEHSEPHIVLLHIGTNDIVMAENYKNIDQKIETAVIRVSSILDQIFTHNIEIVVFLARIINSTHGNLNAHIETFNRKVEVMARRRIKTNRDRIIVVDMERLANLSSESSERDFESDGIHPFSYQENKGYGKMANVWLDWLKSFLPR